MDKLKYIKLENEDGSYSSSIPLSVDGQYIDINGNTLINELNDKASNSAVSDLANKIHGLVNGNPLSANSLNDMVDTTRLYVLTTDGYVYYHNETSWIKGWVYQSSVDTQNEKKAINRTNLLAQWEYTNLYDKENSVMGKFYVTTNNHANGLRDSSSVFISNEIYVHEGDLIHVEGLTTSLRYYCISANPDTYVSLNYLTGLSGATSYDILCEYEGYFSIAGFISSESDTMIIYKVAEEILDDVGEEFSNKIDNKLNITSKFNNIAQYDNEVFIAENCITGKYYNISEGISSGLKDSSSISISEEFYVHKGDFISITVTDSRDHAYLISSNKGTYAGKVHMLRNNTLYEIIADENGYFSFALFNSEKDNISLVIEGHSKIKEVDAIFQSNRFYNKTASFMGDSITYGSNTTKTYDKFLKEKLHLSEIYNYGIRGSSIGSGQQPMSTRCLNMNNSDLIIVFGGTNDFGNTPTELGTLYTYDGNTKVYNLDNSTFAGAMNLLCKNLLSTYYGKEIYIFSPIHRANFSTQPSDLQKNSLGYTLYQYVDIMKEACEEWGIKFINMLYKYEYNPNISIINQEYFSNDGLHPNINGHEKLAETIINEIL